MTSAALEASSHNHRRASGFTLIELMVVIGILVLLASIGLPVVFRAYRNGQRVRQAADLQTISVGLEAFKQDFGDYPRDIAPDTGFAVLGRALIGPGDTFQPPPAPPAPPATPSAPLFSAANPYKAGSCVNQGGVEYVAIRDVPAGTAPSGSPTDEYWRTFPYSDGAKGPGFRTTRGTKVWGPYLQIDKFKMSGEGILDINGRAILYFPALPKKPDIHQPAQYFARNGLAMYNAENNLSMFLRDGGMGVPGTAAETLVGNANDALKRMQSMVGDMSNGAAGAPNGGIDTNEVAKCELPYILWSAGNDGLFGPTYAPGNALPISFMEADVLKCDDVTNFK